MPVPVIIGTAARAALPVAKRVGMRVGGMVAKRAVAHTAVGVAGAALVSSGLDKTTLPNGWAPMMSVVGGVALLRRRPGLPLGVSPRMAGIGLAGGGVSIGLVRAAIPDAEPTPAKGPAEAEPGAAKKRPNWRDTGFSYAIVDNHLNGDFATLRPKLIKALTRMSIDLGQAIHVRSGKRTLAEQQKLWNDFQAGTGNPADFPGTSVHETGAAADVAIAATGVDLWNHPGTSKLAAKHGMVFTALPEEPWHIELKGALEKRNRKVAKLKAQGKIPAGVV